MSIFRARWFVGVNNRSDVGRLFSRLDLALGYSVVLGHKGVVACWKNEDLEEEIRDRFESAGPAPVAGSTSPGFAPGDFVWRAWGKKLGFGMPNNVGSDTEAADLYASRRFVTYLYRTWLDVLLRGSGSKPDQRAPLFRPADFFEYTSEVAAYEQHQLQNGML